MRRALLLVVLLAGAAAGGVAWWRRPAPLPDTVTVEEVVADLTNALPGATIVAQNDADPVRTGQVEPADRLTPGGGPRPGVIAVPPATVRFPLTLPAGSRLRFAVGVAGDRTRDDARSGIRFVVRANGAAVWSQVVDPAERRDERRWLDQDVDLHLAADGPITLDLVTEAETPGAPLAGLPSWAHVRAVRRSAIPRQAAGAGPNVLVLLVDTLRHDRLGLAGASPSPSPALDAFAAGGRVFTEAVAHAPWTLPSVASLMSGLVPASHGTLGAHGAPAPDGTPRWSFLADRVVTWAERARAAGISTLAVSANPLVTRGTNLLQGFEDVVELPWDGHARTWAAAPELDAALLDWLDRNRGRRFAAWVQYMEPHDPYTPAPHHLPPVPPGVRPALAKGWIADIATRLDEGKPTPLSDVERQWLRTLYDAEVATWDDGLAALLAALRQRGLLENTVVVVTADHGEELLEHGRLKHGSQLYDETIRVPLVLVGPGIAPGRVDAPVQGIDVAPTLMAVLGLPPDAALAGRDLRGALPPALTVLSETATGIGPGGEKLALRSVRTPDWKLISTPALPREECYDLVRDPGEQDDVAAPAERTALRAQLDALLAAAPRPPQAEQEPAGMGEKLRALGYVQ